ncbi:MAG: hypothetical protein PHD48_02830 [Alphaproteobacteria bacterium]|nr:hypothetical protein [Alphaproteobacteria bacterium]
MRILSFLGLALILSLSGCGGGEGGQISTTRYVLPEKAGGRMCAFQCRNAFDHCFDACNLSERSCYNDTQAQAIKDYEAYARAQFIARAPVELRPRDFERMGQCQAKSCRKDCSQKYDSCFLSCGGDVVAPSPCSTFLCL